MIGGIKITNMENKINEIIWKYLESQRANPSFILSKRNTKIFEIIGEFYGIEKLKELLSDEEEANHILTYDSLTPSRNVYDFIHNLIKDNNFKTVLDPSLTLSSPVLFTEFDAITGISHNPSEADLIMKCFKEKAIKIHSRFEFNIKDIAKNTFDLILGFPPLNLRLSEREASNPSNNFVVNLALESSEFLKENGLIILLSSSSLLNDAKCKAILEQNGLFIDAIFTLPKGTYSLATNISTHLLIFKKETNNKQTFVAELSNNTEHNAVVLENYKKNKKGKSIQLGMFLSINEYKSFQAIEAQNMLDELGRRTGYLPTHFNDIISDIKLLKDEDIIDESNEFNTIYFPHVTSKPVVSSFSQISMKQRFYYRIRINEEKAIADYISNYFNSYIGKLTTSSIQIGINYGIRKSDLLNVKTHLPDKEIQLRILNSDSKIEELHLKLSELKRELWKSPKQYKNIIKSIDNINKEEGLKEWTDKLPFPISSILWRYYATKESAKRIEHLFHFFEAFSEFLGMIILSCFKQDDSFYQEASYRWIEENGKFKDWYLRATFGNWNNLLSNLFKTVRVYGEDKEKKESFWNLIGNPNDEFKKMIASASLINTLNNVLALRNKWKGHGGITSEKENLERLIVLEKNLNELRKEISGAFDEIKIISPSINTYEDGVFNFQAKELIGARTPFYETTIVTLIPLDKKKLYLVHSNNSKPIELLPFIRYYESNDAVYFYSCIESKNVRWISYHFEKESMLNEPIDSELLKALDYLKRE